jgi:hypothetical protein
MERQLHKGAFLLVEGSTDVKRIERFVDESGCSVINCFGKPNVLGSMELVTDVGAKDCLGLIDADFERIIGEAVDREDVIASALHDFDLENALTNVVHRYLLEVAEGPKMMAQGGTQKYIYQILTAIKPLSILRYANQLRKLRYNLQHVKLEEFFDGEIVIIDKMIEAVSKGSFGTVESKASLRQHIDELMEVDFDLRQLTNGHDFLAALGIALRNFIGSRRAPQTWQPEIEMHFRFGLSHEEFSTTPTFSEIKTWEVSTGLSILKR